MSFIVRCVLFVVCCLRFVDCCVLSVVWCSLCDCCIVLRIARRLLWFACRSLRTVCRWSCVARCSLFAVFVARCVLLVVPRNALLSVGCR